jgi:hypothetical protein
LPAAYLGGGIIAAFTMPTLFVTERERPNEDLLAVAGALSAAAR